MNRQEAKTEICNTLRAYLAKDENGYYTYPLIFATVQQLHSYNTPYYCYHFLLLL